MSRWKAISDDKRIKRYKMEPFHLANFNRSCHQTKRHPPPERHRIIVAFDITIPVDCNLSSNITHLYHTTFTIHFRPFHECTIMSRNEKKHPLCCNLTNCSEFLFFLFPFLFNYFVFSIFRTFTHPHTYFSRLVCTWNSAKCEISQREYKIGTSHKLPRQNNKPCIYCRHTTTFQTLATLQRRLPISL